MSDRYRQFMAYVKETDPTSYSFLEKCEQKLGKPCLIFTEEEISKILPPTQDSHGYPMILLQREPAVPEGKDFLFHILKKKLLPLYKRMVEGFYEEERDAPFYYASLVRSIDPAIHARVQKEVPHCFKKAAVGYTGPSVVSSDKGPIMVLPLEKAWFLFKTEDLEPLVREWYQLYKENPPSELPHAERIHFLEIIRELAPGLYDLIKKVDSTGAEHIGRHETKTGAYVFCASDGLPKFEIGSDVKDMPRAWQRFIFAHELAHYVKKHLVRKDRCNHFLPQLNSDETDKDDHSLSFGHLLDQAASRINEYEADRFAVLGLGAQPEEGIAWRRGRMSLQEKKSGITAESVKKGFNSSHPHDIARIKHLRGLKREVELQKAHGKNDFSLDWEELQRFYQELQAALSGPGASA